MPENQQLAFRVVSDALPFRGEIPTNNCLTKDETNDLFSLVGVLRFINTTLHTAMDGIIDLTMISGNTIDHQSTSTTNRMLG
jgi:hypothetical protein